MHKIMRCCKRNILLVKGDVLQHPLHIIPMHSVISVHIHIRDGSRTVSHFQMADIQPLFLQRIEHPSAVFIVSGRADYGHLSTQLFEIHPCVHNIPGRVFLSQALINVDTVISYFCYLHVLSLLSGFYM